MPEAAFTVSSTMKSLVRNRDVAMIFAGFLAVFLPLIVPLHPLILDMLIILNISAATLILMTTAYLPNPLTFVAHL